MIFKNTKKAKDGFVLATVLWIVAGLMLVALLVAFFSKDTVKLSTAVEQKLQAELEAQSILEQLKFYISTSNYDNTSLLNKTFTKLGATYPAKVVLDGRWYKLTHNKRFRIKDSSATFSAFALNPYIFSRFVTQNVAKQNIIRDSILDWLDPDNEVRLSGAERYYYKNEKAAKYHPSNFYRLQDPAELELIRGMNSLSTKELTDIRQNTYYMNGSNVNLALVSPKMLSAYINITLSQAQSLVELRKGNLQSFAKELGRFDGYNEYSMGFALSKQFIIEIEVKQKQAKAILKTIIDFRPNKDHFYTVISEQNY